ncbi:MAG: glycoside hydrolase family 3 C-terminal domain-containing protein [Lachnospiraceae bacterium]|nr:glycoside hydrolase family 3 C-terminal domain-containing protein [Lachnospiraceae bacterium]
MDIKEVSFEDKLRLVTGQGKWHTADCGGKYKNIHLSDGPHGLRKQDEEVMQNNLSYTSTCFPTASAVACSWDTDLIAKMAKGIAKEAKAEQVSVLLGPGTNIKRSPTCGRNFEYFSEDPYLAGSLASKYVNAVQEEGIGTSLKHFAGNSQETLRMTQNSMIDERTLREIYLRAFEMCVKEAAPATIMASYNRINGQYACRNKWLLTDVLRNEWGYKGLVVSDWGACNDLGEAVEAGCDLEMPDSNGFHAGNLKRDVESGKTSMEALNRAASNVLNLAEKYKYPDDSKYVGITEDLLNENAVLARQIAENSAVLLKNDGILPLKNQGEILIIGSMAKEVRYQGGGSSHIKPPFVPGMPEAFEAEGFKVRYEEGYRSDVDIIDISLEKKAIEAARKAKEEGIPVLFFGGLTDFSEGEGYDRKSFSMPENQEKLFDKVYAENQDLIFVAFGGSPFDMKPADKARATLMMYLCGESAAPACARIISGKVNPSGKLAETFPFGYEDTPAKETYAKHTKDVEYREALFVGYRYYDTFGIPVHFKFGFGMSYTTFEYSNPVVVRDGTKVKVRFDVANTGDVDGAEVAQVYVKNSNHDFIRAERELRGFKKVFLKAGEKAEVSICLDDRSFDIYDVSRHDYVTVNGSYEIQIGSYLGDVRLSETVDITEGVDFNRDDRTNIPGYFVKSKGERPSFDPESFKKLYGRELSRFDDTKPGEFDMCNSLGDLAKHSFLGKIVLKLVISFAYRMMKDKPKDDPEVMMMVEAIKDGTLDLVLSEGGGALPYNLGEAVVLSANGKKLKAFARLFGK